MFLKHDTGQGFVRVVDVQMDGWMDDLRFYVLFNSISVHIRTTGG